MKNEKRKIKFKILKIGPNDKQSNDNLIKHYKKINEYRNGKTFHQLIENANKPPLISNKR